MKRFVFGLSAVAVCGLVLGLGRGGAADEKAGGHGDGHVAVTPESLKWAPHPVLPPGAMAAAVYGNSKKAGEPYVVRVKLPDGFKVPNHWHPSDELVTVLQGTLMIGMGEKFDPTVAKALPAGSFARMPKEVRHFAFAKGETIVQVHGIGPFEFIYVNPADDPRKAGK